ncbi:glutathione binding-like protein [Variovorax ureilyticus]|uniref:Glutathione binding-like protein n=1 Tax=Variovorax ureilyticus TaxID=1836198 RepID=A0ABU8V9P5_9BURK
MDIAYVSVEEAVSRPGLRMVVVGNVPSPWSESAKGIFRLKGIQWAAVRLSYDSRLLKEWAGERSAPVAIYNDEPPRSGWADILQLAERLAPTPALLPHADEAREAVMQWGRDICGEHGLGWTRRLHMIHAGLQGNGGFKPEVAAYLAKKYGYTPEAGAHADARVGQLLKMLSERLKAQRAAGSDYLVGDSVTAADIYSATFMALLRPLPESVCAMENSTRRAFELRGPHSDDALDDSLLAHRAMMYERHLTLPLSL